MKKNKNRVAQIMALLALFAIVVWILGTWILVMFSSWESSGYGSHQSTVISQEELQRIIDQTSVEVTGEATEATEEFTSTWSAE